MCARIGTRRGTLECRRRAGSTPGHPATHLGKKRKITIFKIFRVFPVMSPPCAARERRSPLQPSKGRRARTQGHARDAQGHPRVPQVRRGHSQTLRGHIWEISFFYDFLTNLEIFWSKNGHFSLVNPMKMTPKVHFFTGRTRKKTFGNFFQSHRTPSLINIFLIGQKR